MIKAMRTAASGMYAQQLNVDTIANNLANVNTTGYKKSKVEFQDVLYTKLRSPGSESAAVAAFRSASMSVTAPSRWPPRDFSPKATCSRPAIRSMSPSKAMAFTRL